MEKTNNKKAAVGLSGGVDSSVAAFLLKKEGYDVTGVHLWCWDEKADGCTAEEDRAYAAKTAGALNIKLVHIDYKKEYRSKVISYFYNEYKAGRTPNPDIMCNKEIKFGLFYDWALKNGYDYVATGHYARVVDLLGLRTIYGHKIYENEKDGYFLLSGVDKTKDQSYFLYLLDQKHLERIIFPLGDYKKAEVRQIAERENLPTAKRPDSTGICFIGEVDIKDFLKKEIQNKLGLVIDMNGLVIGEHDGVWFYTIGQRHGFRLTKYFSEPMYVVKKDVENNVLTVGTQKDAYKKQFSFENPHWINTDPFENKKQIACRVRIRHLGKMYECTVTKNGSEDVVELKKPIFGVADGQSAVLYDKDVVLGGGTITT